MRPLHCVWMGISFSYPSARDDPSGAFVPLLGAHELLQRKDEVKNVSRAVGRWIPLVVPHVLAFTTFLCGVILLFSGATPAIHSRLRLLEDFFPLPIMEISHFLGSFAGVGL